MRNERESSLVAAIRGPVVLITLGVLFLIDQAGVYAFRQTWPVLIIVFGVLSLLERSSAGGPPRMSFPSGFQL
jgi:hypothetical protein